MKKGILGLSALTLLPSIVLACEEEDHAHSEIVLFQGVQGWIYSVGLVLAGVALVLIVTSLLNSKKTKKDK